MSKKNKRKNFGKPLVIDKNVGTKTENNVETNVDEINETVGVTTNDSISNEIDNEIETNTEVETETQSEGSDFEMGESESFTESNAIEVIATDSNSESELDTDGEVIEPTLPLAESEPDTEITEDEILNESNSSEGNPEPSEDSSEPEIEENSENSDDKNNGEIVENESEPADTLSDEENNDKANEKARKKEKRKAWVLAHKLFLTIVSIVFIVVVGIIVGHFVSTAKIVFVHNADDLIKATTQNKKTELKLKADVTVDEDITLTGYNLDLDKYTLTVNGNLTIKNESVHIGKQLFLWSEYENGGKIVVSGRLLIDSKATQLMSSVVADNLIILGENATVCNEIQPKTNDYADVWFNCNETTDVVLGGYAGDIGHIVINSQTIANIHANSTSTVTLNGKVNEISGGEKVFLKDSSKSTFVRECAKLYISENADWGGFDGNSVQNHYFVQKLSTPELIIENTQNGFEVHISHVDNADAYMVVYDGLEAVRVPKDFGANYTTYALPERSPDSYKLSVYAVSDIPDEFNDGNTVSITVDIFATLEKPQILSCEKIENESGDQYILTIESVKNALSYEISVEGKKLYADASAEDIVTVDLSSIINGVGTYNIKVIALANGTNYKDSQVELYSFINTVKLKMGEITESESDGKFTYSWDRVVGATAYEIVYGEEENKLITTENTITLDEKTVLWVRPLGKGYYKDGDSVSINLPEFDPENPIIPNIPEEE